MLHPPIFTFYNHFLKKAFTNPLINLICHTIFHSKSIRLVQQTKELTLYNSPFPYKAPSNLFLLLSIIHQFFATCVISFIIIINFCAYLITKHFFSPVFRCSDIQLKYRQKKSARTYLIIT